MHKTFRLLLAAGICFLALTGGRLTALSADRGMRVVLACERGYTDIARTVYVIELAGRGNYISEGQPDPHRRYGIIRPDLLSIAVY